MLSRHDTGLHKPQTTTTVISNLVRRTQPLDRRRQAVLLSLSDKQTGTQRHFVTPSGHQVKRTRSGLVRPTAELKSRQLHRMDPALDTRTPKARSLCHQISMRESTTLNRYYLFTLLAAQGELFQIPEYGPYGPSFCPSPRLLFRRALK